MKLTFDYTDYVGAGFDERVLRDLAMETMKVSRYEGALAHKNITLDIAIVDAATIQKVNKKYRDTDDVTDVISVGEYSDKCDLATTEIQDINLGEVLLCWSDIKNNATIQHTEEVYEFAYVFTHGILHLIGYQHGDEMFALQDRLSVAFCADVKSEKS